MTLRLGLRANLGQFALLSVLTLWIGWFLGMERVVLPLLARDAFQMTSLIVATSFIASFGFTKALLNMLAGSWSDKIGRKPVLMIGWILGLPIPFMLILATSWQTVVLANVLMGFNQALTWTMTVTSKIDLVGVNNRGFALGINEFSGYTGQATGGIITGMLAAQYGLRPLPFYFGLASVILGAIFSALFVKETKPYVFLEKTSASERRGQMERHENSQAHRPPEENSERVKGLQSRAFSEVFATTTWRDKTLFSCSQAGLVEKFADTLVWGVYPLFLADRGIGLLTIGLIVGLYQAVWGISQLFTGALSDRIGRKPSIVAGMWIMSAGIILATIPTYEATNLYYLSAVVTGFGMALVYPILLAAVADISIPEERGTSLGVYRLWRDSGYGFGALFVGGVIDTLGTLPGFYLSSAALFASGLVLLALMKETIRKNFVARPPILEA